MRIYIIHSSSNSKEFREKVIKTEEELTKGDHYIMNPLPDKEGISNEELHNWYYNKMKDCDAVYAMEGYDNTRTGNPEMAEAMILRKTIFFEQKGKSDGKVEAEQEQGV